MSRDWRERDWWLGREMMSKGVARRSKKRVEYEHGSAHVGQCVMRHACEDPDVSGTAGAA